MKLNNKDTLLEEYDFDYSKAVWGKHTKRIREKGTNIVLLEPDIADYFEDSAAVNQALRSYIKSSGQNGNEDSKMRKSGVRSSAHTMKE